MSTSILRAYSTCEAPVVNSESSDATSGNVKGDAGGVMGVGASDGIHGGVGRLLAVVLPEWFRRIDTTSSRNIFVGWSKVLNWSLMLVSCTDRSRLRLLVSVTSHCGDRSRHWYLDGYLGNSGASCT